MKYWIVFLIGYLVGVINEYVRNKREQKGVK